jgi:heme O synthase-like polyprenyltransferase
MNFRATTSQTLDSLDRAFDPEAHRSRARVLARGLVPSHLRRLGGGIGVISLAVFLIAAMSALVLMLLAKLVFAFVAVGFER